MNSNTNRRGHAFKQVPSSLGLSHARVAADDEAVRRAADILNAGEKVAMLVGQGARDCVEELTEVADLLGAGAAKALLGKDVLPDDLPWVTGSIGLLGTTASWHLMMDCDTLLTVGSNFPYTQFMPQPRDAITRFSIGPLTVSRGEPLGTAMAWYCSTCSLRSISPVGCRPRARSTPLWRRASSPSDVASVGTMIMPERNGRDGKRMRRLSREVGTHDTHSARGGETGERADPVWPQGGPRRRDPAKRCKGEAARQGNSRAHCETLCGWGPGQKDPDGVRPDREVHDSPRPLRRCHLATRSREHVFEHSAPLPDGERGTPTSGRRASGASHSRSATPTRVGHMSSVAQRVLERLDAELSDTNADFHAANQTQSGLGFSRTRSGVGDRPTRGR